MNARTCFLCDSPVTLDREPTPEELERMWDDYTESFLWLCDFCQGRAERITGTGDYQIDNEPTP